MKHKFIIVGIFLVLFLLVPTTSTSQLCEPQFSVTNLQWGNINGAGQKSKNEEYNVSLTVGQVLIDVAQNPSTKNSAMGFSIGIFSFLFGFGLVWYMFWLAAISVIGMIACVIIHLYQKHPGYHITAEELEKLESKV